ncbi:hypothetical protein Hdeb2414_s0004g00136351 [Helianthus debilis subsp. tardiflorus]
MAFRIKQLLYMKFHLLSKITGWKPFNNLGPKRNNQRFSGGFEINASCLKIKQLVLFQITYCSSMRTLHIICNYL